MKFRSIVFAATVLAGFFAISSCTKTYTCHCNIYYSGQPGLPDSSTSEYSITDSKSNAQSECKKNSATYNNNYINTTETCYLY